MVEPQALVDAVDRAGYRLTEPRRAVARLVADRPGHFTADDLVRDARGRRLNVGRATVFRALDLFTDLNLVERVDLPSGGHAYISCEPAHHHHVICDRCGRTAEVEDCSMSAVAREVGRRSGYEIQAHRVELYGLCPDCRRRDRRARRRVGSRQN